MAKTLNGMQSAWQGAKNWGEGPGRSLYELPTHAGVQQAAKYPLMANAMYQLMPGIGDTAIGRRLGFEPSRYQNFQPIEEEAIRKYQNETVPSIAARYAGQGGSSGRETRLANAEHQFRTSLAAEKAKFGQEEERLQQSKLEQLLKFGMVPTSERILMEPPKGEVPQTIEQQAANLAKEPLEKGKEALENWWSKTNTSPEQEDKFQKRIANSPKIKAMIARNPNAERWMKGIMDVSGFGPSQFASLSEKNINSLGDMGLEKLYKLSQDPFFKDATDPNLKAALRELRTEKEIESMMAFIEDGNTSKLPSSLKGNKFWDDVRKQKIRDLKNIRRNKRNP